MIQSKEDLRACIRQDTDRMGGKPKLRDLILHNEKWYIYMYVVALRHIEYYINGAGGAEGILYSCYGGTGTNISDFAFQSVEKYSSLPS